MKPPFVARGSLAALLGVVMTASLHARGAFADETSDLCLAGSLQGQILRSHGRLTLAREHLEECARPECEEAMRTRCAQWLGEVRAEIPILAVHVVDDRRGPIAAAVVHLDGSLVDASQPFPVDPGRHEVRADYAGRRAVVTVDTRPGEQEVVPQLDLRSSVPERPVSTATFVSGAVSLAGFVALAAFGTAALVQQGSLSQCMPFCDSSHRGSLEAFEDAADIGLGVGIAGLLAGTIFYLTRPTVAKEVRIGARGVAWDF
jgi:hypothetical protein